MSQLAAAFARARAERRALLIGYLPAGFPSVPGAQDALLAMSAAGVDVVEVGLPYSDPLMDGPSIARAVEAALAGGCRVADVLATVAAVAAHGVPTTVMSYWNPVEHYGPERFAADLAAAGGCGVITPDLTPEEAGPWLAATAEHGLDAIFVVAPVTDDARLRWIGELAGGFIYAASLMGVTGARAVLSGRAAGLVARVRAACPLPVAVGLGVSNAAQAADVAGFADGVIVGSAFVDVLAGAPDAASGRAAVSALAETLAAGVRAGRGARLP